MMAQDTHKFPRPALRPSWLLGFLLAAIFLLFIAFVVWQVWIVPQEASHSLTAHQWILAVAALTATTGWVIAAIVTTRNSVKQHTITALLQSRLSAEYMSHARNVSTHYMEYARKQENGEDLDCSPTDGVDIQSLQYILNYFEFIAIGVRHGDLHEGMLKTSLQTIIQQNVTMSREWILRCRKENNRLYLNLAWLHARWCPNSPSIVPE